MMQKIGNTGMDRQLPRYKNLRPPINILLFLHSRHWISRIFSFYFISNILHNNIKAKIVTNLYMLINRLRTLFSDRLIETKKVDKKIHCMLVVRMIFPKEFLR